MYDYKDAGTRMGTEMIKAADAVVSSDLILDLIEDMEVREDEDPAEIENMILSVAYLDVVKKFLPASALSTLSDLLDINDDDEVMEDAGVNMDGLLTLRRLVGQE